VRRFIGFILVLGLFLSTNILFADDLENLQEYEKACNLGNSNACIELASIYSEDNIKKSFEFYHKACYSGSGDTCYNLGMTYYNGLFNIVKNKNKALNLMKDACDLDYAKGCSAVGFIYNEDTDFIQKKSEGISFYAKGCELGDGDGCNNLGYIYEKGKEVKQDYKKAIKLYDNACRFDSIAGCISLGTMYSNGNGVEQNYQKAMDIFNLLCELNILKGCNNLGVMYLNGQGIEQNYQKAIELFTKTCNQNNAQGCFNLGEIYNEKNGIKQNYKYAINFYDKSCSLGLIEGCTATGIAYITQSETNQNFIKALDYFNMACSNGDSIACYNLGILYHYGKGIEQDYNSATVFYSKACDSGYIKGCFSLGTMYMNGLGVERNEREAIKFYKKACDLNHGGSCANLGTFYNNSNIKENQIKSIYFYKKSCDLNSSEGCFNLGNLYDNGDMVNKDKEQAIILYNKACAGGLKKGCTYANFIYKDKIRIKNENNISLQLDTLGHTNSINNIITTKEGNIITSSEDKTIRIWDSSTGKEIKKILGQIGKESGEILAIALSPDEKLLAVGGIFREGHNLNNDSEDIIRVYNYSTGKIVKILRSHENIILNLSFSSNAKYLISGSSSGIVKIWNMETFTLQDTIKLHTKAIYAVKIIKKDNVYIAVTVGLDKQIALYDINHKKILNKKKLNYKLMYLGISHKHIAVSGNSNEILIYDYDLNLIKKIISKTNPDGLSYSKNGEFLIAGANTKPFDINIYNTKKNYNLMTTFHKHTNLTKAVSFLDNTTAISAGGNNNEIYIWNSKTSSVKRKIEGVGASVINLGINGDLIVLKNDEDLVMTTTYMMNQKPIYKTNRKLINLQNFKVKVTNEEKIMKNLQNIPTKQNNLILVSQNGGEYGYNDATLILKKYKKEIIKITRDATNGFRHNCYGFYKDYIISGGSSGEITIYNLKGKEIANLVGHIGEVSNIALDGDRLISGGFDQTIKVWNLKELDKNKPYNTLYPQLNIFITKTNEHIAWTNEGYFTASENATQYLYFHINQGSEKEARAIPMERLYDHFFRPDLIQLKLSGDEEAYQKAINGMDYKKALSNPPPKINLLSIDEQNIIKDDFKYSDINTSKSKTKLTFDVKEYNKGGIGVIRIYQEGKLIQTIGEGKDNRKVADVYNATLENRLDKQLKKRQENIKLASKGDGDNVSKKQSKYQNTTDTTISNQEGNQTIEAILQSGDNQFCVEAFNKTNTVTSYRECVTIHANIPKRKPKLYGVVVGINNFETHPKFGNLRYSQNDAKDIKNIIEKQNSNIYESIEIETLLGAEATQDNILDKLKAIKEKASIDDTIIFYISTHGTVKNNELYLLPEIQKNDFIEFKKLFKAIQSIPSLKQIMIVDACQSGQASDIVSSIYDSRASVLAKSAGVHLLLATTKGTSAFESQDPKIQNGVFTHQILTALKDKKTDTNNDNSISIIELSARLKAQAHTIEKQYPIIRNVGGDVKLREL